MVKQVQNHLLEKMNQLGGLRTPFLFIIDYEIKAPIILPLDEIDPNRILYNIKGFSNDSFLTFSKRVKPASLKSQPISFQNYNKKFDRVQRAQKEGNSYLLNLTQPTAIKSSCDLYQIYKLTHANYKLWVKNEFTLFSPECFVRIEGRRISSYPMKGTLQATQPNACEKLIENPKELAEHITIVDLIRNDLNCVASDVKVERFRYIDKVNTDRGVLLQASSEISGQLREDFHSHLGDIFYKLLPAGSITGAPKKKTMQIIKEVENYNRGYYTGVFGYYDGYSLESAVMIRFIEKNKSKESSYPYLYKSGGGITIYSNVEDEYRELKDKIYLSLTP